MHPTAKWLMGLTLGIGSAAATAQEGMLLHTAFSGNVIAALDGDGQWQQRRSIPFVVRRECTVTQAHDNAPTKLACNDRTESLPVSVSLRREGDLCSYSETGFQGWDPALVDGKDHPMPRTVSLYAVVNCEALQPEIDRLRGAAGLKQARR